MGVHSRQISPQNLCSRRLKELPRCLDPRPDRLRRSSRRALNQSGTSPRDRRPRKAAQVSHGAVLHYPWTAALIWGSRRRRRPVSL